MCRGRGPVGDRLHPGGAPHVLAHIPRRERHRPTRTGHQNAGDAKREDLAGREGAARLLQNHLPGMDFFRFSSSLSYSGLLQANYYHIGS